MKRHWQRLSWLVALATMLLPVAASALAVPPVPTDVPIVDQAKVLTADQRTSLGATIAVERQTSGNQIGVLILPTLEGEAIEDYSLQVARQWGIGEKPRNNGVLLLVAIQDRKLRIEVGYGLEGALTDARSNQIIRNDIAPLFRQQRYYDGIRAGLDGIIKSIHNEYVAAPEPRRQSQATGAGIEALFWILIALPIWLSSIMARTKSWWLGGLFGAAGGVALGVIFGFVITGILSIIGLTLLGLFFDWAVSRNFHNRKSSGLSPSWWAGGTHFGGSGGSGGGGFGGFGGGSFGGGGSSGSW